MGATNGDSASACGHKRPALAYGPMPKPRSLAYVLVSCVGVSAIGADVPPPPAPPAPPSSTGGGAIDATSRGVTVLVREKSFWLPLLGREPVVGEPVQRAHTNGGFVRLGAADVVVCNRRDRSGHKEKEWRSVYKPQGSKRLPRLGQLARQPVLLEDASRRTLKVTEALKTLVRGLFPGERVLLTQALRIDHDGDGQRSRLVIGKRFDEPDAPYLPFLVLLDEAGRDIAPDDFRSADSVKNVIGIADTNRDGAEEFVYSSFEPSLHVRGIGIAGKDVHDAVTICDAIPTDVDTLIQPAPPAPSSP